MKTVVAAIAFFLPSLAFSADLFGKVVKVADGDTLTVLTSPHVQVKVRLSEIDAPEKKQPYGQKAKRELSDMAFGKTARVVVDDVDRYGRTVGQVYVENIHVNSELVRRGAAWCYRKYLRGSWCLMAEYSAQQAERGLWALQADQRMPPWEWRKSKRKE